MRQIHIPCPAFILSYSVRPLYTRRTLNSSDLSRALKRVSHISDTFDWILPLNTRHLMLEQTAASTTLTVCPVGTERSPSFRCISLPHMQKTIDEVTYDRVL